MSKRKALGWAVGAASLVLGFTVLFGFLWVYLGRPAGLLREVRAGLAARPIRDPDQRLVRYLEERYGNLANPTNRQAVFVDFFDPERIQALQVLVKHTPDAQRQANLEAMARWLAAYRESMGAQERAALNARFQTAAGRAMLGRATAQYNAQDVRYRGYTAPVISELLRTLHEIEPVH
jgi:hypothetical protein